VNALFLAITGIFDEQVSQLMDRFEKDFENLDVQSAAMEGSMQATTTLNAPQSQIDSLMQQVADEAGCVVVSIFHDLIFLQLGTEHESAERTGQLNRCIDAGGRSGAGETSASMPINLCTFISAGRTHATVGRSAPIVEEVEQKCAVIHTLFENCTVIITTCVNTPLRCRLCTTTVNWYNWK
jgi:hypothetical protein